MNSNSAFSYEDLESLGRFLKAITATYESLEWKELNASAHNIPEFVTAALGPKLLQLPSFSRKDADREAPSGLGAFLDTTHTLMRSFGRKLGETYAGVFEKEGIDNSPSCPFSAMADKLQKTDGAKVKLPAGIEIETTDSMSRIAFCASILSKTVYGLNLDNRNFTDEYAGADLNAFFSLLRLCRQLNYRARKQDETAPGIETQFFNLPIIERKFLSPSTVENFGQLHNLLVICFEDMKDPHIEAKDFLVGLRQLNSSSTPNKNGFILETQHDLAALFYGMCKISHSNSTFKRSCSQSSLSISNRLASAPDIETARQILTEPESQKVIVAARDCESAYNPRSHGKTNSTIIERRSAICEVLQQQAALYNHTTHQPFPGNPAASLN